MTVVEDALSKETLYTYNARGQIETSEDADGVALAYAYDENGLLLSVTDDVGRVTTYGRDAMGNVTSVTEADGTASERLFSFTLDENFNVIESTDALNCGRHNKNRSSSGPCRVRGRRPPWSTCRSVADRDNNGSALG